MTSTALPSLKLGGGDLRISLLEPLPADNSESAGSSTARLSNPSDDHELEQPKDADRSTSPLPPPPQNIPVHPIPALQDAFSESLDEATNGSPGDKPKLRDLDVRGRREALIAQDRDEAPFDSIWRYRPGQKQHELLKLIAQISFGVYLLLHGMANSNAQVINILQGHIDEVDEFLEVALEDLSQATDDLNGRIEHLKLPLANVQVFEQLLEDRNFRLEIIEGNEKIDHVLSRTSVALKQWDADVEAGLSCTAAFTSWLKDEENSSWRRDRPDVADIFDAMKGNTEGWLSAFDEISDRVQEASNFVARLSTIIGEMEKKAGEVSRKKWATIEPYSNPSIRSHGTSGSNTVSMKSSASSQRSTPLPSHAAQASLGASTVGSGSIPDIDLEEVFPVPGGLQLQHASRSDLRLMPDSAGRSVQSGTHESKTHSKNGSMLAVEEPLYVLQPRTYSPQYLDPGAAASVVRPKTAFHDSRSCASPPASLKNALGISGQGLHQRRASIRSRVSQKTNPPEAIKIPPNRAAAATARGPSPNSEASQTSQSNPFDSAYGSDSESMTQPVVSQFDSEYNISPPRRPQVTHSPCSDHQQYYRPVRASPHSPLQQRPHTAVDGGRTPSMHSRNQSSAVGGMSTLSSVTNATAKDDDAQTKISATKTTRTVKKKKSAFGWFKKAFTMDEDEKAAFEARRAMQHQDRYYEPNSPRFLDGRRIR
ncbi:hypothetical protein E4U09_005257 [Claviceps aff. purpurea]|uniref:Uncharacterized protein n=2 Tax=Claviceps TaxID=5110 RepID=M1W3X1_CLAP2|nr:hypothetical protein E4U12_005510 [Claviceps purpurea]KAG6288941.1 hypothetical protein E4U09_005257 [Claviceps aff. purpurea]CCE28870.1 uncharacterized protein CPUR_02560 [Claviceps purpurea 20.1]KAG6133526.1 hypothetical protein E4U38_002764 [Claviceps purpurea]KAG6140258.1 hypothetical protein E4U28_003458 [Claviceps purpurea]